MLICTHTLAQRVAYVQLVLGFASGLWPPQPSLPDFRQHILCQNANVKFTGEFQRVCVERLVSDSYCLRTL
jgi:hypothetical protein